MVRGVLAISPDGREERVFTNEEMQFGYRHSVLSDNGYIALFASLRLAQGDPAAIALTMRELNQKRNSKRPVQYPSAGGTFKRPEGHFAGKLIEDAGLKGRDGRRCAGIDPAQRLHHQSRRCDGNGHPATHQSGAEYGI